MLIEQPNLYPHLSGLETWLWLVSYRDIGRQRAAEVLELVVLADAGNKKNPALFHRDEATSIAIPFCTFCASCCWTNLPMDWTPAGIVSIRTFIREAQRKEGMSILVFPATCSARWSNPVPIWAFSPVGILLSGHRWRALNATCRQGLRLRLHL